MRDWLIERVLRRSGAFAFLRGLWRADDRALRDRTDRLAQASETLARRVDRLDARVDDAHTEQAGAGAAFEAAVSKRLKRLEQQTRLLQRTLDLNARYRLRRDVAPDVEATARHVRATLAAAAMRETPMPHLVVEGLMPDPLYDALLQAVPPPAFFSQRDVVKQNLRVRRDGLVPDETLDLFGFLESVVIADMIVPALLERFEPYFSRVYEERYGDAAARVAALPHVATDGRLMLRRPGYHLNPHLDPRRVSVTGLFYLARPGDDEAHGTSFYSLDGAARPEQSNTYSPERHGMACTLAASVPFRANTAVFFLNSGAAHGAGIPGTAPPTTERYAYQFYMWPEVTALASIDVPPGDRLN
jgi:hypothetical protein